MHTEHLQNVRMVMVVAGWLVAIAVTSLMVFVFEAMDVATFGPANVLATLLAVALGFLAGGFFVGFRTRRAPILHGIGMGVTSLVAWVIANVLAALVGDRYGFYGLDASATVSLILVQMVAAVLGALLGYNIALRGRPGLSEDIEVPSATGETPPGPLT